MAFPNTQMGTGHWNTDGHEIAGKLVFEEFNELFLEK